METIYYAELKLESSALSYDIILDKSTPGPEPANVAYSCMVSSTQTI